MSAFLWMVLTVNVSQAQDWERATAEWVAADLDDGSTGTSAVDTYAVKDSFYALTDLLTTTTTVFTMSQYGTYSSYTEINDTREWGQHALRWKQNVAAMPHYVVPSSAPGVVVYSGDAATLNSLEASSFYNASWALSDPAGGWTEVNLPLPADGALYAALAMYWWGSPTYLDFTYWDADIVARLAVIERISVTVDGSTPIEDLCGWSAGPNSAQTATATSCATNQVFTIDWVEVSVWDDILVGSGSPCINGPCFAEHIVLSGTDFAYFYGLGTWGSKVLVSDPPSSRAAKTATAMAQAMAPGLVLDAGDDGYLSAEEAVSVVEEAGTYGKAPTGSISEAEAAALRTTTK